MRAVFKLLRIVLVLGALQVGVAPASAQAVSAPAEFARFDSLIADAKAQIDQLKLKRYAGQIPELQAAAC